MSANHSARSFFLSAFLCVACATTRPPSERLAAALLAPDGAERVAVFELVGNSEQSGDVGVLTLRAVANDMDVRNVHLVREVRAATEVARTVTALGKLTAGGELSAGFPLGEAGRLVLAEGRMLDAERLRLTLPTDNGAVRVEDWRLVVVREPTPFAVERHRGEPGEWLRLPIPQGLKGALRLRVAGRTEPHGVFLPAGARPPELSITRYERDDVLSRTRQTHPPEFAPAYFDPDGAAVWTLSDHRMSSGGSGEVFWFLGGALPDGFMTSEFRWESIYGETLDLSTVCDPSVDIEVRPRRIARGESVRITVTAAASAGIDQFGWRVVATPNPHAEGVSHMGDGQPAVSQSWTRRLDTPGRYRFQASASDTLHRSDPDGGHLTEGLCSDSEVVEVMPGPRRSYSVAFILLAPEGTDSASAATRAQLAKIEAIKRELPRVFQRATDFTGAVDVSYPTVVLTPPGPIVKLSDGAPALERFFRRVTRDSFYSAHPDDFDFLCYYQMYPDRMTAGSLLGGRHFTVRTAVAGLGRGVWDVSRAWGSGGRLRGVGLTQYTGFLPDEYSYSGSRMLLVLHEIFGHQWGVDAAALQTTTASHFQVGIQGPTHSVLYAVPWEEVGLGRYRIRELIDEETGWTQVTFHPWTLYLAGLKLREEVPASVLKITPDPAWDGNFWIPVTVDGSAETLTLDSIIAAEGDRRDVP